jgi:hypothetical protein
MSMVMRTDKKSPTLQVAGGHDLEGLTVAIIVGRCLTSDTRVTGERQHP